VFIFSFCFCSRMRAVNVTVRAILTTRMRCRATLFFFCLSWHLSSVGTRPVFSVIIICFSSSFCSHTLCQNTFSICKESYSLLCYVCLFVCFSLRLRDMRFSLCCFLKMVSVVKPCAFCGTFPLLLLFFPSTLPFFFSRCSH
jgi:hypothetical protein